VLITWLLGFFFLRLGFNPEFSGGQTMGVEMAIFTVLYFFFFFYPFFACPSGRRARLGQSVKKCIVYIFSEWARWREENKYKIARRQPALSLKRFAKPFLNTQPWFVLYQDKMNVKKTE